MNNLFISDISNYLGAKRISNFKIASEFNYPMHSLKNKVGFRTIREEKMLNSSSYFGYRATKKLLRRNNKIKDKIEVLIVITQNPDNFGIPHTSSIIHKLLNLNDNVACFDIGLGCSGYVYGLSIISSFMHLNKFNCGILITSDQYSNIIKNNDKQTKMLFGDAATATLIENKGFFKLKQFSFGTTSLNNQALIKNNKNKLFMDGRKIFNFTHDLIPINIKNFLIKNKMNIKNIDLFLCHQGSKIVIETIRKSLDLQDYKIPFLSSNVGNTVSSSIPLMIEKIIKNKNLKKIVICGFGVGLSWGIGLIERNEKKN